MKNLLINTFLVYIETEPRPNKRMKHTDPILSIIQAQNKINMNTPAKFNQVQRLLKQSILNN
jgi:hypothetical protein